MFSRCLYVGMILDLLLYVRYMFINLITQYRRRSRAVNVPIIVEYISFMSVLVIFTKDANICGAHCICIIVCVCMIYYSKIHAVFFLSNFLQTPV